MPQIDETPLPGVGRRQDFGCRSGARVGVISRPSGRRELIVYDRDDPDAVSSRVELTADESQALGELLQPEDATRHLEHLGEGVIPGLAIDWIVVPAGRPSHTIADLEMRSRTGATVVAIVRDEEAQPAPGPDATIAAHDTVVLVGTAQGIEAATALLETGSLPSA